jgi:ribosomal protein S18 acetylase RimI-like enzyme
MNVHFRKAITPTELRSLVIFDHKAFRQYPGDRFAREDWLAYESWWMIIDGRKIGCCAFETNVDFQDDLRDDGANPARDGSLYIASTAVLPEFRGLGLGSLIKCWQISYARLHSYSRIVTNTRKGNRTMIGLNKKFGFQVLRTTPGYYDDPREATVVMERRLEKRS